MMGFLSNPTPMLAGVCSRLARLLGCNVWALRAGFIVVLLVKMFWAVVIYAVLALLFQAGGRFSTEAKGEKSASPVSEPPAWTDDSARNDRIRELDRRFRAWEETLDK